jgi:hypothetical protein
LTLVFKIAYSKGTERQHEGLLLYLLQLSCKKQPRFIMTTEQPNILFIFTDQHRLSAVGCYGETPCQTPNLDRLAEKGFRFETAYTV